MTDCVLALMTRAPIAGQAKTRLIPRLGPEGAAILHGRLTRHALATARESGVGPMQLWRTPAANNAFLSRAAADFGASLFAQPEGDLGERMLAVFRARGAAPLLLMGTDAPIISPQTLRECADALREGEDAVFLPAEDGGYALIGLQKPRPELFDDMRWSVATVMAETRRRLGGLGLRWREPATVWDVDQPEDVDRLMAAGLLSGWPPPRT